MVLKSTGLPTNDTALRGPTSLAQSRIAGKGFVSISVDPAQGP
jgi:hypothetical protein